MPSPPPTPRQHLLIYRPSAYLNTSIVGTTLVPTDKPKNAFARALSGIIANTTRGFRQHANRLNPPPSPKEKTGDGSNPNHPPDKHGDSTVAPPYFGSESYGGWPSQSPRASGPQPPTRPRQRRSGTVVCRATSSKPSKTTTSSTSPPKVVCAGSAARLDPAVLNFLSIAYLLARIAFIYLYIHSGTAGVAKARTCAYMGGMGLLFTIFVMAAAAFTDRLHWSRRETGEESAGRRRRRPPLMSAVKCQLRYTILPGVRSLTPPPSPVRQFRGLNRCLAILWQQKTRQVAEGRDWA
ncbi:uncharacterized protein MYCGRDRAFT_88639 [Zymoseptoria tritici IPO323]|uniref:Uncharacterized protein n=1 Tax=Zymoseptoria tritici (strain CBS 115943 / IPO323) TaxID=336722 RepID=F9WZH2_ZYMTI|nr:uncharacterized protein MYCGRDRAFT_88639 [Zymoseptoria tritici IPO323]EGP90835.1 hypothetical protein MYCGRDRAFT_88639 [Zymoseptoria tritici IPO323]